MAHVEEKIKELELKNRELKKEVDLYFEKWEDAVDVNEELRRTLDKISLLISKANYE